jgi:hypothetical protein
VTVRPIVNIAGDDGSEIFSTYAFRPRTWSDRWRWKVANDLRRTSAWAMPVRNSHSMRSSASRPWGAAARTIRPARSAAALRIKVIAQAACSAMRST